MSSRVFRSTAWALALAALGATGAAAAASIHFVPATLVATQSARVNVVNLEPPPDPDRNTVPPDPCRGTVTYYDVSGAQVGSPQAFQLAPGQAAGFVDPFVATNPVGTNGAVTLRHSRAVVAFAAAPKGLLGLAPPNPCRAADAAFEVYDVSTGGTLFLSPGVISGFNPQPDPPGIVSR